MSKIAIVTGASSGIGRATASSLNEKGCKVYDLSRHENPSPGITHIDTDVTDSAQVNAAIARILKECGRIDILVNNAGFGISGAIEMTDPEDSHAQLEVNLFGADNLVRAVLPHMRKAHRGRIIFISSIAGIVPIPFQAWYSAGKSAITSYALALQNEVRPYGITVCAILPGDIASGFTAARKKSLRGDDVYKGRISRSVAVMEKDETGGMDPAVAGACIARCALRKGGKPLVAIGFSYKAAALLVKFLPRRASGFLVGKIYGG